MIEEIVPGQIWVIEATEFGVMMTLKEWTWPSYQERLENGDCDE